MIHRKTILVQREALLRNIAIGRAVCLLSWTFVAIINSEFEKQIKRRISQICATASASKKATGSGPPRRRLRSEKERPVECASLPSLIIYRTKSRPQHTHHGVINKQRKNKLESWHTWVARTSDRGSSSLLSVLADGEGRPVPRPLSPRRPAVPL